jgi:hypothetical protein
MAFLSFVCFLWLFEFLMIFLSESFSGEGFKNDFLVDFVGCFAILKAVLSQ